MQSDRFGDMLFNSVLQPLGSTTHVPTITVAQEYNEKRFSILASGRSAFHLSALEATFIKTLQPNLRKQKEFVYSLKITH